MTIERRSGGEIRLSGRELSGRAMPYGEIAPNYRERFEPGAFESLSGVPLLLQHDPESIVLKPDDVRLHDGPDALELRGVLQESSAAYSLVKRRALRGLSVGFAPLRESRDGDIRIIERAKLHEVSLVDAPAYPGAHIEVRRSIGRMRSSIPYGRSLACGCKSGCTKARFEKGSLRRAAAPDSDDELLAIRGSYADTVASKKARTLRLVETDEGLDITIDLPDTAAARDLAELGDSTRLLARPVWDETASTYEVVDGTAVITDASVKAILIGATDADEGWPQVQLDIERRRRRFFA